MPKFLSVVSIATMSNNNNNQKQSRKRQRGGQSQPQGQPKRKKQKVSRGMKGQIQSSQQLTGKGSTRNAFGNKQSFPVEETEYIAEIVPTAFPNFSVQTFPVNPGQGGTFPWLSNIARNFEKYEFEMLEFIYKREVSEFAANGQAGKVIMAFDPDAADPAFHNKQQMEDNDPHTDCMPCENMVMRVPLDMLQRLNDAHFVRPGLQPAGTDIKTYDVGNLYVACQGTAANTAVGELHVHYRLRLRQPVLIGPQGNGVLVSGGGALAAATPFGSVRLS